MNDPRRLLDDPGLSPLGRALIDSTTEDGPSPDSRRGAARKLGIAAALIGSGEALATGGMWWKLVMVLVLAGGVTVGVMRHGGQSDAAPVVATASQGAPAPPVFAPAASSAPAPSEIVPVASPPIVVPPAAAPHGEVSQPRPARVSRVASTPSESSSPTAPSAASSPAGPPPAATDDAPADDRAAAAPADVPSVAAELPPVALPQAVPPPAPSPPPTQVDPRRLAAEVALLDRARAALAAHDVTTALALLDEHARTFADGVLGAEASAVHIEALVAAHRNAEAAAEAQTFLTRFPHSPLAPRVRELTSIREK